MGVTSHPKWPSDQHKGWITSSGSDHNRHRMRTGATPRRKMKFPVAIAKGGALIRARGYRNAHHELNRNEDT